MEPILSDIPTNSTGNGPRDLLARLYREIGISAVAAALEVTDSSIDLRAATVEKRVALASALAKRAA